MSAWLRMYSRDKREYWYDKDTGEYLEPEDRERRIVVPIAALTVETMIELLLTKKPSLSVPASNNEQACQETAEHNERALHATWYQADINTAFRDSLWMGLVMGWGVLQILWDDNAGKDQCPIVAMSHDPRTVYAAPGRRPGEWSYIIHVYPRLVSEIKDEWLTSKDKRNKQARAALKSFGITEENGLNDNDMVMFVDYWDKDVNACAMSYIIPDRGNPYSFDATNTQGSSFTSFVKPPTEHGYGFLPWQIYFPNRLPFQRVGERMGVSVFHTVEDLIREFVQLVSSKATMLDRWQDPPLITKTTDGRSFEPVRSQAGLHIRLLAGEDEDAYYLINPTPMPQIDSQLVLYENYLERGSIPRVLQGQYVGDVSGVAMSLLRNPTLMRVAYKQETIERAAVRLNADILRLYERFLTSPLYMWGQNELGREVETTITPSEIDNYYRNSVKLSASLPTDDAATINLLIAMIQIGLISKRTGRDVMQQTLHEILPQSLTEEEELILAEKVLENPEILQTMATAAGKKVFGNLMQQAQPEPENPRGGRGEREITPPAGTLASQTPGMFGGNTQPDASQVLQEMAGRQ